MTEKQICDSVDIETIMDKIPHRYPMLLVDKLVETRGDEYGVGVKNVTFNEPIFQGHFPGHPIFPGVLIVEAMGQTAAITVMHHLRAQSKDYLVYFMSVEQAKFRKPVKPGDQLFLHVEKKKSRGKVWKYYAEARVNGEVHAEALLTAMILKREEGK